MSLWDDIMARATKSEVVPQTNAFINRFGRDNIKPTTFPHTDDFVLEYGDNVFSSHLPNERPRVVNIGGDRAWEFNDMIVNPMRGGQLIYDGGIATAFTNLLELGGHNLYRMADQRNVSSVMAHPDLIEEKSRIYMPEWYEKKEDLPRNFQPSAISLDPNKASEAPTTQSMIGNIDVPATTDVTRHMVDDLNRLGVANLRYTEDPFTEFTSALSPSNPTWRFKDQNRPGIFNYKFYDYDGDEILAREIPTSAADAMDIFGPRGILHVATNYGPEMRAYQNGKQIVPNFVDMMELDRGNREWFQIHNTISAYNMPLNRSVADQNPYILGVITPERSQ